MEIWADSTDSRYEISNIGRFRNKLTGHIRSPSKTKSGYRLVVLSVPGSKHKGLYIHHEVAFAFIGKRPDKFQVSHLDGNTDNNDASNLAYESVLQNITRKREHGTQTHGESHGTSKLKLDDVHAIRRMRESGKKLSEISKLFGVGPQQISRICKFENWRC